MERQEYWLLKMVQFANLVQAGSVDIKLGRRRTIVVLDGDLELEARELYDKAVSQPASRHPLFVALRTLAAQKDLQFDLEAYGSLGRVSHPDSDSPLNLKALKAPGLRLTVERGPVSLRRLRTAIKRNRDEQQALTEFCWTSPVPVRVDGRLLKARLGAPGHQAEVSEPKQGPPVVPISLIRGFSPAFQGRPELQYLRDLESVASLRPRLLENLTRLRYQFPAEAMGEAKEDSGFAYRMETFARYRLFKGRHKTALKEGLESLPNFLDWLCDGALLEEE